MLSQCSPGVSTTLVESWYLLVVSGAPPGIGYQLVLQLHCPRRTEIEMKLDCLSPATKLSTRSIYFSIHENKNSSVVSLANLTLRIIFFSHLVFVMGTYYSILNPLFRWIEISDACRPSWIHRSVSYIGFSSTLLWYIFMLNQAPLPIHPCSNGSDLQLYGELSSLPLLREIRKTVKNLTALIACMRIQNDCNSGFF